MTTPVITERLNDLETRLARMESRLVQLMVFLKMDPNKRYGDPAPVRSGK